MRILLVSAAAIVASAVTYGAISVGVHVWRGWQQRRTDREGARLSQRWRSEHEAWRVRERQGKKR